MGNRVYANVAVQPYTTKDVDIYGEAILTAIQYDMEKTPLLKVAALSDMRLLMRKQYDRGRVNKYIFGLPESTLNVIPNIRLILSLRIISALGVTMEDILWDTPKPKLVNGNDIINSSGKFTKASYVGVNGLYETHSAYLSGGGSSKSLAGVDGDPDIYYSIFGNSQFDPIDTHLIKKHVWTEVEHKHGHSHYDDEGHYSHTTYTYTYTYSYVTSTHTVPYSISLRNNHKYYIEQFTLASSPHETRYALADEEDIDNYEKIVNPFGDYYPVFPLKVDFKYWDDDSEDQAYKDHMEKSYGYYRLGKLEDLTKSFKDIKPAEEGSDDIDDVNLFNGISIYSKLDVENKFLYFFFLNAINSGLLALNRGDNPYSVSNQINVREYQFNYTLMFRDVIRTEVDNSPFITGINYDIEYTHSWEDNPKKDNLQWVAEPESDGGTTEKLKFVDGDNQWWSNNIYTITMKVNGAVREFIEVQGIQTMHKVRVADVEDPMYVEDIPSGQLEQDYYDYLDIEDKSETDVIPPPLTLIPLDQTIINNKTYFNKFSGKEARSLFLKSFHLVIYGSKVIHVHWTKELRIFVFTAINLAMIAYSIISLGAGLSAATVSQEAFKKFVFEKGKQYLLTKFAQKAFVEAFGEEKGQALFAVALLGYALKGVYDNRLNISTPKMTLILTKAVLTLYAIKQKYDFEIVQKELIEEEGKEEKEELLVSFLESPDEFLSRTTNGNLGDMAGAHLTPTDLIKVSKGIQIISPNIAFEDLTTGEE